MAMTNIGGTRFMYFVRRTYIYIYMYTYKSFDFYDVPRGLFRNVYKVYT